MKSKLLPNKCANSSHLRSLLRGAPLFFILSIFALFVASISAPESFGQIRLPQIDPSGNRIFLPAPNSTTVLGPRAGIGNTGGGLFRINPLRQNGPFANQNNRNTNPFGNAAFTQPNRATPPAFTQPARPPNCDGSDNAPRKNKQHLIPNPNGCKSNGQRGQILLTPSRIVAPVNSEVVVLAGICGGDGHFVLNQPLEWMLSNDSVGQLIQVGGMDHPAFNKLVSPTAKKFDGQYAWGRTGLKQALLTRGTPTPADDIQLRKGQAFVSVSSASPGTSYITAVAPNAEAWDKRRATTTIHWVDGIWSIPTPTQATAGTVAPLTTVVNGTDGNGIPGWKVKYSIVGGAPAEFAPSGSQTAEATTNDNGQAIAQIRQPAGQFEPGTTQVRVDVVRPPIAGERELVVESGITQIAWSAPALTLRAIGPAQAGIDQPFNYRLEVTNPGDQLTRDVVVRTRDLDDSLEYLSSTPKPTQYGKQFEWELGDIAPGSAPKIIDMQLKSNKRGAISSCFEVASESDRLRTEACAQTEITAPCLGLDIEGPETAKVNDEVTFNIGITNQCDEPLRDIRVQLAYDSGLSAPGRSNPIEAVIDELQFGERRELPVGFRILQPGRQCFELKINAAGGHSSEARECIEVSNTEVPKLALQLEGGNPTRVGDKTQVNAIIANVGNTPINAVTLTNRFSPSLEPTNITKTFNYEFAENDLLVDIGRLEPGDQVLVEFFYEGMEPDANAKSEYTVTSVSGASATQATAVRVEPNPDGGAGSSIFENPNSGQPRTDGQPNFQNQPGQQNPNTGVPNDSIDAAPRNESPIRVPRDSNPFPANNGSGNLSIETRTLTPDISLTNPQQRQGQIGFLVANESGIVHNNVDISFKLSDGLRLVDLENRDANLGIVSLPSAERFDLNRKMSLRPNRDESLPFVLYVEGTRPGPQTVTFYVGSEESGGTIINEAYINVVE